MAGFGFADRTWSGAQLPVVATFGRWLLVCGEPQIVHPLTKKDMFLWLSTAGFVIVNVHVLAIAHCCFRDCHQFAIVQGSLLDHCRCQLTLLD